MIYCSVICSSEPCVILCVPHNHAPELYQIPCLRTISECVIFNLYSNVQSIKYGCNIAHKGLSHPRPEHILNVSIPLESNMEELPTVSPYLGGHQYHIIKISSHYQPTQLARFLSVSWLGRWGIWFDSHNLFTRGNDSVPDKRQSSIQLKKTPESLSRILKVWCGFAWPGGPTQGSLPLHPPDINYNQYQTHSPNVQLDRPAAAWVERDGINAPPKVQHFTTALKFWENLEIPCFWPTYYVGMQ